MALTEVCAAIADRLRLIPGFVQLRDAPPPGLAEDRTMIVYPRPGPSTPMAHGGKHGQAIIQNADNIIVEWHLKKAKDQAAVFLAIGLPLFDACRDAIWSEMLRNRFGGTVDLLTSVTTDHFGIMTWDDESDTWGFRLILDLSYGTEISAGKVVT